MQIPNALRTSNLIHRYPYNGILAKWIFLGMHGNLP